MGILAWLKPLPDEKLSLLYTAFLRASTTLQDKLAQKVRSTANSSMRKALGLTLPSQAEEHSSMYVFQRKTTTQDTLPHVLKP